MTTDSHNRYTRSDTLALAVFIAVIIACFALALIAFVYAFGHTLGL